MPQCRGITPGVPVPPDHKQLTELTQDLMQWRQELVGDEEAETPLMEPIHFEKVAEPGRWPCSAWGLDVPMGCRCPHTLPHRTTIFT